jgi:hypothetical protein
MGLTRGAAQIIQTACLTGTSTIQDNPLLPRYAEVAKLADALDSGSSARKGVRVQIPPSAPTIIPRSYQMVPSVLAPTCLTPPNTGCWVVFDGIVK